ncbi:MarR family transcriptional regulator [Haloferacaceae archaeon DSL9]
MKVTDSTQRILDVLQEGRATPGYLVERTGLSRQTIHNQLNQLLAGEHVEYIHEPTGLYELISDPRNGDSKNEDVNRQELREDMAELQRKNNHLREQLDDATVELGLANSNTLTKINSHLNRAADHLEDNDLDGAADQLADAQTLLRTLRDQFDANDRQ